MSKLDLKKRPTRKTRAKQADAPLIEDKLLAAMEKMLEDGYSLGQINIVELSKQAGISKSTFYSHFKDKGELVSRLMGVVTKDIIAGAGLWFEHSDNPHPEDLHRGIKGIVYAFKKHQAIVAAIDDLAPHDDNVRKLYEEMMDTLCQQSREAVAAVHEHNKGKSAASPLVASILTWVNALYLIKHVAKYDKAELDELAEALGHITVSPIFKDT